MKKVIEERRNEAYTSRPDGAEESHDPQVHRGTNHLLLQEQVQKALLTRNVTPVCIIIHRCTLLFVLGEAAQ